MYWLRPLCESTGLKYGTYSTLMASMKEDNRQVKDGVITRTGKNGKAQSGLKELAALRVVARYDTRLAAQQRPLAVPPPRWGTESRI